AMPDYKWVDTAPVYERDVDQFTQDVKTLKVSFQGWNSVQLPKHGKHQKPNRTDEERDAYRQMKRWNQHISGAKDLFDLLDYSLKDGTLRMPGFRFFSYLIVGAPVGVMAVQVGNTASALSITYLVTHPGTVNCGGILIERAVNLSEELGKGGRLTLDSLDKASSKAYAALGFTGYNKHLIKGDGGAHMELDPRKSSQFWKEVNGVWKVSKFAEENVRYASTPETTKQVYGLPK